MQNLFKNTPLSAFTPKRQAELQDVLEGFRSFKGNFECLADLVPHLTFKQKLPHMKLFHGLDFLWALSQDGCDILQEINRRDGFLYDYHEADASGYENVDSPDELLKHIGLQYLAFSLNGLEQGYRSQATTDLAQILSKKYQSFTKPLPHEYGITRLFLAPRSKVNERIQFHHMDTLVFDRRLNDDEQLKLADSITHYLQHIANLPIKMDYFNSLRDIIFRAYAYDYAVSMKSNDMAPDDIVYNLDFTLRVILDQLNLPTQNYPVYHRNLMINACMPFTDLLSHIGVTTKEISFGLPLGIPAEGRIEEALSRHLSGVIFQHSYRHLLEDIVNHLADAGHRITFDEAIDNEHIAYPSLSIILKLSHGYTPKIEDMLSRDTMPFNSFKSIVKEVNLEKLSQHSLKQMYFHICLHHTQALKKYKDSSPYTKLRANIKTQESISLIKYMNGFVGAEWKKIILPHLSEKAAITVNSANILELNSADLPLLKGISPEVKRYLLSKDMGMEY
jgi:hypothetical protein